MGEFIVRIGSDDYFVDMTVVPDVQKVNRTIARVSEGSGLKDALDAEGLSVLHFHQAISTVRELYLAYVNARETQAELDVDEAVKIADDEDRDPQQAKNMIDIRKWRASKHHSRLLGDRIEMQFSGSVSVSDALAEARARLLPSIATAKVIEAEVIPTLETQETQTTNEPDIFS